MNELAIIRNTAGPALPALIAGAGERPGWRFMCWSTLPAGPNPCFYQPASFWIIKFVR